MTAEPFDKVSVAREILSAIGVDPAAVQRETRLRADLGLDSTETAQLEIELRERSVFNVDLWDSHDYTVAELADSLPDR